MEIRGRANHQLAKDCQRLGQQRADAMNESAYAIFPSSTWRAGCRNQEDQQRQMRQELRRW